MTKKTREGALQTKKQILSAALDLFTELGYEKTSLSDIARKANVTRGAIYWHFEDKGEILCDLCVSIAYDNKIPDYLIAATRENETDPLGCLKKWVILHSKDAAVNFFTSTICSVTSSVLFSDEKDSVKVQDRLRELLNNRIFHIKEALQNAIRRNQLPSNCDVDLIAEFIHTFLIGQFHALRDGINTKLNERFEAVVDNIFKILPFLTKTQTYRPNYK